MTQTELEKQILDIINLRISTFLSSLPSMQREQAAGYGYGYGYGDGSGYGY